MELDKGNMRRAEDGYRRRANSYAPYGFHVTREPGVVVDEHVYKCSNCSVVVHDYRETCPCCYKRTLEVMT